MLIYEAKNAMTLPDEAKNYAAHFAEHTFRNPAKDGAIINSNHSCRLFEFYQRRRRVYTKTRWECTKLAGFDLFFVR